MTVDDSEFTPDNDETPETANVYELVGYFQDPRYTVRLSEEFKKRLANEGIKLKKGRLKVRPGFRIDEIKGDVVIFFIDYIDNTGMRVGSTGPHSAGKGMTTILGDFKNKMQINIL